MVAMPRDPLAFAGPGPEAAHSRLPRQAAPDRGPAISAEMPSPGEPQVPLFLFKELTKVFSQWI
jgi:hypothetical protein